MTITHVLTRAAGLLSLPRCSSGSLPCWRLARTQLNMAVTPNRLTSDSISMNKFGKREPRLHT
jgi:hypothetical protein